MTVFGSVLFRRHVIAGITLAWFWCAQCGISIADDPEIHVAASAEEIFSGESVEFQVEIRNSKNPTAPDMSPLKKQFDFVSQGDESRNQSSTFIINGRVSQQNVFSHLYRYQLTPKLAGDLSIPSVSVEIDGKTLSSTPLPLRVIEAEKQDLVLVELAATPPRVYPTQPFTVTARILVRPLPNDANLDPLSPVRRRPPHLQVNLVEPHSGLESDDLNQWLRPQVADDGIGFTLNNVGSQSIFDSARAYVFGWLKGRETRNGLDGTPIRYFVYELSRTFTPAKTGSYSFGPAVVKGTFVAGQERGEYAGRRLVASAAPISVEVLEIPTAARPSTYCGGIGEYTARAYASPTKLRVGDPLTLTVEFERGERSGALSLISAPDLSAVPGLTDDFELIDKNPTGRVEGSTKHFAYGLRPRHAGVSIPALKFATFDPKSETFLEKETAPVPLDVSHASQVSAEELVGSPSSASSSSIKTRTEGIFQNVTDPSELRNQRVNFVGWITTTAAIWGVAGCLMAFVTYYRHKSSDAGWMRRQRARRHAQQRLAAARQALAQHQTRDAFVQVRAALIGFVADMQNRIAEGLTSTDVDAALTNASVPADVGQAVRQLLEAIEAAEYGAGGSVNDPRVTIETAEAVIAKLTPYLERGV
ncbi:BatD family protein [Schlesneria paludicola]|uniref:BatD family protein n=1 Tax=Schlesneria paludicola TaxID=360056 RepID=UPI00029A7375|nr:BatD family protein [Schlesneria paludicola]